MFPTSLPFRVQLIYIQPLTPAKFYSDLSLFFPTTSAISQAIPFLCQPKTLPAQGEGRLPPPFVLLDFSPRGGWRGVFLSSNALQQVWITHGGLAPTIYLNCGIFHASLCYLSKYNASTLRAGPRLPHLPLFPMLPSLSSYAEEVPITVCGWKACIVCEAHPIDCEHVQVCLTHPLCHAGSGCGSLVPKISPRARPHLLLVWHITSHRQIDV